MEEPSLEMVVRSSGGSEGTYTFRLRLKSFFDSSKFSDLTIKVEGCEFKVHKIVVCVHSEYFHRALEGEWKEAVDNEIRLKDDPHAIEAMIRFMYGHDYDGSGGGHDSMLFNAKVHGAADKYRVTTLMQLSKEKFDHAVKNGWDMDDFPHLVTEVYEAAQYQELRQSLVQISHDKIEALLKKDTFVAVLEKVPGFAADLVQLMARDYTAQADGNLIYCLVCATNRSDWQSYLASQERKRRDLMLGRRW